MANDNTTDYTAFSNDMLQKCRYKADRSKLKPNEIPVADPKDIVGALYYALASENMDKEAAAHSATDAEIMDFVINQKQYRADGTYSRRKEMLKHEEIQIIEATNTIDECIAEMAADDNADVIRSKKFLISLCVKNINCQLDFAAKYVPHINHFVVDLGKRYAAEYSNKKRCGRKPNTVIIKMIDMATGNVEHTFDGRSEAIEATGISKGNLAKCIKSTSDNVADKSEWKTYKYGNSKYWFLEEKTGN